MPPFAVWQRPPPKEGSASGEVESQGRHDDGLTRNRLDQLFQHCADLGVMVEWADLGGRRHGHYRWRDDAIVLDLRLTAAQATACLAHELGHQRFGDTCSTPANERRAWQYGAALTITPREYEQAEERVGHHLGALAIELCVTPRLVEAWRDWWRIRGRQAARRDA